MKAYLYLLLFTLLALQAQAQFTADWATTIYESHRSGSSIPFMYDPETTTDPQGNIYVTGLSAGGSSFDLYLGDADLLATGDPNHHFYLAQIAPNGQPNWLLRFSGRRGSSGFMTDAPTLFPRPEGGVILVSLVNRDIILGLDTIASVSANRRLLIAHISPTGEVISHSLTYMNVPTLSTVKQARNGDIVVAGQFRNRVLGVGGKIVRSDISPAYVVARINNQSGEVVWAQSPGPDPRSGYTGDPHLEELADGNFLLIDSPGGYHSTSSSGTGNLRFILASKLNGNDGSTIWQKEIAQVSYGHLQDFQEMPNGDIYLVGHFKGKLVANNGESYQSLSNESGNLLTGCLLKMTADGMVFDAEVTLDGFTSNRIIQLPNQQYLVGGRVNRESAGIASTYGLTTGFVLKLFSPTDQLLYQQNISNDLMWAANRPYLDVKLIDDQHIICTGRFRGRLLGEDIFTPSVLDEQAFIAQLNIPAIDTPPIGPRKELLKVFPNPARDIINLDLGDELFGERPILIYNLQGQLVLRQDGIGERNEFSISIAQLPMGTYFVQLGENGPKAKVLKLGQR